MFHPQIQLVICLIKICMMMIMYLLGMSFLSRKNQKVLLPVRKVRTPVLMPAGVPPSWRAKSQTPAP